jgi:hypothetical protein
MTLGDIYLAPGRAIAWAQYMFPGRGDVWASGRRKDSPIIHLLFSTLFWGALIYFGVTMLLSASHRTQAVAATEPAAAIAAQDETAPPPAAESQDPAAAAPVETAEAAAEPAAEAPAVSPIEQAKGDPALLSAIDKTLATGAPAAWKSPATGLEGYAVASSEQAEGDATCRNVIYSVRQPGDELRSPEQTYCRSSAAGKWALK